ncbi:MAG TPA: DUF4129 domain-containing protein [Flavisolibacter sp.]|jgi:hypothetical protein|nr:DUF4129 domain-containing protein [Flavisolibacter sp.]
MPDFRLNKMCFLLIMTTLLLAGRSMAQQPEGAPVGDSVILEKVEMGHQSEQNHFDPVTTAFPVTERKLPPKQVEELRRDDDFWYANEKPVRKVAGENRSIWNKDWVANLIWILIVGIFVGILIWFLANSQIGLFRRRPSKISADEEELATEENIFAINFEKEIGKAAAAGNYNLAIRLHYLQVLKRLTDASLIQYDPSKTNSAYLGQLAGTQWYRDFFRLTRQFEYCWYGQFPIAEPVYNSLADDFTGFKNRIAA